MIPVPSEDGPKSVGRDDRISGPERRELGGVIDSASIELSSRSGVSSAKG